MSNSADLIIIGSGSTAFAAALRATSYGAQVLMFEKSVLGGTCINWGCIPSKTLIHAALFRHEAHLGALLGLGMHTDDLSMDFRRVSAHREQVVQKLRQERYLDVLKQMPGLTLVKGTACFLDPHTVEAAGEYFHSDRFLVAVGGDPRIPDIKGVEKCDYLTSRTALLLKKIPRSLIIIGGGVIAVELGQMLHRLGCRVTILEYGSRLLPPVEPEPARVVQNVLCAEGLQVVTDVDLRSLEQGGEKTSVYADVAGKPQIYSAEKVLLAVGTTPATSRICLDKARVEVDRRGFIQIDDYMRTSAKGIWAAGDVTGKMMIATVGARQGIVAVDDMFNSGCGCAMDYLAAPMAIFTDPEIGMVGHTEESARQAGFDVIVNTMPVEMIPKAQVTGHVEGIIKMIADRVTGRLLGVHLACHRGADMINEAALALRMKATVEDLANTMHVYPSIGEGLKLCAQGFSRDLSKLSCCAE